jgi:hypothetical protein
MRAGLLPAGAATADVSDEPGLVSRATWLLTETSLETSTIRSPTTFTTAATIPRLT